MQQLLWMPQSKKTTGTVAYPFGARPARLWTLYGAFSEADRPALPIAPIHLQRVEIGQDRRAGTFLEDFVHDWVIRRGQLQYYSRALDITRTGVWLLLEWDAGGAGEKR